MPPDNEQDATVAERIAADIKKDLLNGGHAPHAPFHSHRRICRQYGAGLNTVRRALDQLEKEGLLYRRERAGTFVHPRAAERLVGKGSPGLTCINFLHAPQPLERARFYSEYLLGYTDALEALPLKQRFAICSQDAKGGKGFLSDHFAFDEQGCVFADAAPPSLLHWLREREIPFVVHCYKAYPAEGLPLHPRVIINKVGAFFEATRHLLELGHRRIGLVGLGGRNPAIEGYAAGLMTSGLDAAPGLHWKIATEAPGRIVPKIAALLKRPGRPTALVACNDATALDVLAGAQKAGLSVPRDLSVVGYHDLPESSLSTPPLTTMTSPKREQGRLAVAMLLGLASDGRQEYETRVLDCELVERGSTAPPGGETASTS